ncbi:hypothetical protein FOA43_003591 [Brettanomyces nanus]|uniref:Uncharacterized protein n=1 Tax=Eeniella nana TaxID=13502 RepID=A0A875S7D7_EENNA|nr:uncharacterized protein FOA43_003591 [Brettanomyces nanus]QPG76205.1 hypothetical protein FOA43_003591 [Brettanomyces nanus]
MAGLVSRWADDESLVKKAVTEDVREEEEDPFKKVRESKLTMNVAPTNNEDSVGIDHREAPESENVDKGDSSFKPVPKNNLSNETQRLFPVEDGADEKFEQNVRSIPTSFKTPKHRRRNRRGQKMDTNETNTDFQVEKEDEGSFIPVSKNRLSKETQRLFPVGQLPTPPNSAYKERLPREQSRRSSRGKKGTLLPSKWADRPITKDQLPTPPSTGKSYHRNEHGRQPDEKLPHRGGGNSKSSTGTRGKTRARGGRASEILREEKNGGRIRRDRQEYNSGEQTHAKDDRRGHQSKQPQKLAANNLDFDKELKELMQKFDTKSSWADDLDI